MSNQLFVRVWDTDTKIFSGGHYEDLDYKLKDNETLDTIPDGLRPPYRREGNQWVGASEEEFKKLFPGFKVPLSPSTEALNLLGQQLTLAKHNSDTTTQALTVRLDKLTEAVNTLGQLIAKQDTKEEANNG